MRRIALVLVIATAWAAQADAQDRVRRPELRGLFGAAVPTGSYRHLLRIGPSGGVQLGVPIAPWTVGVAGVTLIAGETKFAPSDERWSNRVDIAQAEVGAELAWARAVRAGWWLDPFVGAGGGARLYLYRGGPESNAVVPVVYAVGGVELRNGRGAVRLEGREHLFRYRAASAGIPSATRGEIVARLGLTYHLR